MFYSTEFEIDLSSDTIAGFQNKYVCMSNVNSVVEFKKWWVLKCNIFTQELTCSKEIVLKQSCDELWFVKKCQNCTFKVNFLCQKSTKNFEKKISLILT